MEQGDLDLLKDIPGFKAILRAILKSQMKHLVEQLSKHGGEEAMVLTTSLADGSFYNLGSVGAKGFLDDRDEIKSQFLGYCLKSFHPQQTEQSPEAEKTIGRTADNLSLNIEPRSSKRSISSTRQKSESILHPVSLTRAGEKTLSETNTHQTVGSKAGSTDFEQRRGRASRKRPSETITSEKPAKRTAVAETIMHAQKTVNASVETSQGITVVTSDTLDTSDVIKVKDEDLDAKSKDTNTKESYNILPLHTETPTSSENKDKTDTRQSDETDLPGQIFDNEGVLTEFKVEPADDDEVADIEESTSQLEFSYGSAAAEGEDKSNDSVNQSGGNFKKCPLICRICGKLLSNRSTLNQHERRHEKVAPYICCSKPYFSFANYKRHRCQQHGEKKEFCCHKCGASFAIKADLNRHMRREARSFKHVCETCGSVFEYKQALNDHMGVHLQEMEKRHRCLVCQKTFRFKSNLRRHQTLHTDN